MDNNIIEITLEYIEEHIHEKISLIELANITGYSPFYFSKLFSESMKVSVTTYIRIRKLQYAMDNLVKGERVIDVAFLYGFESHEGFTRSFKRLFGSSPQQVKSKMLLYHIPELIIPNNRRSNYMSQNNKNLKEDMHQIIFEFLRESSEEVKGGFCSKIDITILEDNEVRITDNGRGIPMSDEFSKSKEVMKQIFDGQPITIQEYNSMEDFSNLGIQTANSLCEKLGVKVYCNGKEYTQDYVRGIPQHDLLCEKTLHVSGLEITLKPDSKIFGDSKFSKQDIEKWLAKNGSGVEVIE